MALQKDSRTGIFQFRKVIPEPLRPMFGKREYKVSLETRDLAQAKVRMLGPAAEYERLLEDARTRLRGGWTVQANSMVERWLQETARDNRWLRFAAAFLTAYTKVAEREGISGPAPMYTFEPETRDPADNEALRLRAVTARARMLWPERLERLMRMDETSFARVTEQVSANSQRPLPVVSALSTGIAKAFQRKMIEAVVQGMNCRKEKPHPEPPPLLIIQGGLAQTDSFSSAAVRGEEVGLTITEAFEAWRDHKSKKGKPRPPQRIQEWDLAVRRFIKMYGDIDMGLIRPQMVRDYRDKLLELPSRAKDEIKILSFDEQAVIAERDQLDTLAPSTVNKHLTALRSITEHVIDKLSKIPLELNAARLAKFVETEDSETKRLPFDEEDLKAIFRDLLISDTTGISSETLFWIVLLAAFTAGRLEELGTLRPSNSRSANGIPYIAIERDRAHVRATQGAPEKTLKSSNSNRDIPLHPILLRAGFLQYVERRREEGAEWLFPDLKANKYGKRTYRVSRLFARYLEDLGITDDEKVFHSFRHSVRRNLRGRAKEEMVDLICGHSDGKVGRRYGRGADMRPLRKVIELIDLEGPNWDKVVSKGREYAGLPPEAAVKPAPVQLGLI